MSKPLPHPPHRILGRCIRSSEIPVGVSFLAKLASDLLSKLSKSNSPSTLNLRINAHNFISTQDLPGIQAPSSKHQPEPEPLRLFGPTAPVFRRCLKLLAYEKAANVACYNNFSGYACVLTLTCHCVCELVVEKFVNQCLLAGEAQNLPQGVPGTQLH